jgi:hypothetical protein
VVWTLPFAAGRRIDRSSRQSKLLGSFASRVTRTSRRPRAISRPGLVIQIVNQAPRPVPEIAEDAGWNGLKTEDKKCGARDEVPASTVRAFEASSSFPKHGNWLARDREEHKAGFRRMPVN